VTLPQKTPNRKQKTFLSILTRRPAETIEGLNSSLALAAGDFWPKNGRPIAAVKGKIKTIFISEMKIRIFYTVTFLAFLLANSSMAMSKFIFSVKCYSTNSVARLPNRKVQILDLK